MRMNGKKRRKKFSNAQALDVRHPVPHFFLSLVFFAQNNLEASRRSLAQGLALSPRNALGQNIAALLAFREGKAKHGVMLLKQHGLAEHPRIQAFLLMEMEKQLI